MNQALAMRALGGGERNSLTYSHNY